VEGPQRGCDGLFAPEILGQGTQPDFLTAAPESADSFRTGRDPGRLRVQSQPPRVVARSTCGEPDEQSTLARRKAVAYMVNNPVRPECLQRLTSHILCDFCARFGAGDVLWAGSLGNCLSLLDHARGCSAFRSAAILKPERAMTKTRDADGVPSGISVRLRRHTYILRFLQSTGTRRQARQLRGDSAKDQLRRFPDFHCHPL